MRELKFRAWDTEEHSMSDPMTMRQLLTYSPLDDDSADNLMVMQYTGLKDRNGKEIYEGDIVSSKYIIEPGAIVTYSDRHASFSIGPDWPVGEYYVYANGGLDVQVVGNVHENPELVKT